MIARAAWPLLLTLLCACDSPAPDPRGTPGSPVQLDVRLDGLSEELAQVRALGAIPIKLDRGPTDADRHTDLAVGANQALIVVPSRGEPILYQGAPLRTEYHHHGRLLVVFQGTGDVLAIHSFVEPVRWYTVLRASL